ncbi:MAG: hypothetical protein ABJC04_06630 [Verrucomicrobiota bacterium]
MRRAFLILAGLFFCFKNAEAFDWSFGPFYDDFPLTLAPGERTEILGPVFYREKKETQTTFALPPLFSCARDPDVESTEWDFLYPILTYDQYGAEYRFQILQVFAFAGGHSQEEEKARRFTLFPIYFQQRSDEPDFNYTAFLPVYGTLKNRLFRDEIFFAVWPVYVRSRKKDVVTDNYLFPIFHLRKGNALHGWQVWPLIGMEHKDPTIRTNYFAEKEEVVPGHDKLFVGWPFFFKNTMGIGTDNPEKLLAFLPLFSVLRSPNRDSTTAPWPLGLTITDDRARKYHEVGAPWPLIVFARGEGKYVSRVWPLFSHATNATLQSDFYLWPVYKYNRYHAPPLDRDRLRIMFFLYSDIHERNLDSGDVMRRVDFWPFYTFRRDLEGKERLQILSLLEPFLPNSKSIERNYSPLWSIWRAEKNPKTGATSQSLLWNLYRHDHTPDSKKFSLLLGAFQYESTPEKKRMRLFYIPITTKNKTN